MNMEKDCKKEMEGEDRRVNVVIDYCYRGERVERVITMDGKRVYADCQSIEARAKGGMNPLDRFEDWLNDAVSLEEAGRTVMPRGDVGDREMRLRCLEMIIGNGSWCDAEDLVGMAMVLERHVGTGEKVEFEGASAEGVGEKETRRASLDGEAAVVGGMFRAVGGYGVVFRPGNTAWESRGGRVKVVVEGEGEKSREEMDEFVFLAGTGGYRIASYPSREKDEPGVDDQENKGERKEDV